MKNLALAIVVAGAVAACQHSPTASSAALAGRIDPSVAGRALVVATDRAGRTHEAAVAADGSFRLALPARATYRIVVRNLATNVDAPIVFPRTASLQATLRVRGSGAATLGLLRLVPATTTVLTSGTAGGDAECMDGVDAAGQTCVDDNAENEQASCSADQEDTTQDGDQNGESGEANDDHGASAMTGAGAAAQVVVPTVNPPVELGDCGDGDGEQNDDNNGANQ